VADHDDALHRAARYRAGIDDAHDTEDVETGAGPRSRRSEDQALWVDQQVREAMARGEFDDLPYAGKPLPHIDTARRPDWWLEQLFERERISGVLPEALQLRKDDALLDDELDRIAVETEVRNRLEDFNARIVAARRQLQGGPPVITPLRDIDAETAAWRDRRRMLGASPRSADLAPRPPRRRWWRRGPRR